MSFDRRNSCAAFNQFGDDRSTEIATCAGDHHDDIAS
jgi:hypothetical protein